MHPPSSPGGGGTLQVTVERATVKNSFDLVGKPDLFVVLRVGGKEDQTRTVNNSTTPQWNQTFKFEVRRPQQEQLEVKVYDQDNFGKKDHVGGENVALHDLRRGERVKRLVPLPGGRLELTLEALNFGLVSNNHPTHTSPPLSPLTPPPSHHRSPTHQHPPHTPQHPSGGYTSPGGTGYPGPNFQSTPAGIYSDRDTLLYHHKLYNQAFETIIQFFEHEDRVLTQEKLAFEEWKLAEQQMINQQSAELMRKQQELRQYEADLLGFQHSVETSEHELVEQSRAFEDQHRGFLDHEQRENSHLTAEQRELDELQRRLAQQAGEMEERRQQLRQVQMRQQSEQAQLQRQQQKLEQQELQQKQQQEILESQQQKLFQQQHQLSP